MSATFAEMTDEEFAAFKAGNLAPGPDPRIVAQMAELEATGRTARTVRTPPTGDPLYTENLRNAIEALSLVEYRLRRKELAAGLGVDMATLNAAFQELAHERKAAAAESAKAGKDSGRKGAILLFETVEPWPEPVALSEIIGSIERQIARFVVCSAAARLAAALYCVFSFCYQASPISPIFAILSAVKGSGKTRLIGVLLKLTSRPLGTSNISPAALYRAIAFFEPMTMFIDEIDLVFSKNSKSERAEELRNVLNAGHTRTTALVIRCDGESLEPKAYSTFCPKIVAGLGSLPETVTDRAIVCRMARRTSAEPIESFSEIEPPFELAELRRKLARWAADESEFALSEPAERIACLRDRQNDNWRPLLQIAAAASPEYLERTRAAAIELSEENDEADDPKLALLRDLWEIAKNSDPAGGISSRLAVSQLKILEGKDYSYLTEVKLSRSLRGFSIRPSTLHPPGAPACKGYKTAELRAVADRYLILGASDPSPVGAVRTVPSVRPVQPELVAESPEVKNLRLQARAALADPASHFDPDVKEKLERIKDGRADIAECLAIARSMGLAS